MLVTGSPAPGRKEVCGWQAGRLKGSVAVVAPTAVWWRRLLRYYGPVRMLSSGEGSGKASFHAGSASDLDLPDEQPPTHSTLRAHPGPRPSVRFFGVRQSSGGDCERRKMWKKQRAGHASQQRHRAMLWEACYGCSFPRMRRLSSCLPRNGSSSSTYCSQCSAQPRTPATCSSSSLQQHHRAGALHY